MRAETVCVFRSECPDLLSRGALLATTALASTLLAASLIGTTPAGAADCTAFDGTGPAPIAVGPVGPVADSIVCLNTEPRINNAGDAIYLATIGANNTIELTNTGTLTASDNGIFTETDGSSSHITITNSATISAGDHGISALTDDFGSGSNIVVNNSGAITSGVDNTGDAIYTRAKYGDITVNNSAELQAQGNGVHAYTKYGDITVKNTADINATVNGIEAFTGCDPEFSSGCSNPGGNITITNDAKVTAAGKGIYAYTAGDGSSITITNSGFIDPDYGIDAHTAGANSIITITNTGTTEGDITGIRANAAGANSTNLIVNTGTVYGGNTGIDAHSTAGTHIINTGDVSAGTGPAIFVDGPGDALVENAGLITGYIVFDTEGTLHNQPGGTFEARRTSDFGPSSDLVINEGVIHTANDPNSAETTQFVNLESFRNSGVISLQDGAENDVFRISQMGGGTGLDFAGSGNSTLGVDAFLGAPGSRSDRLIIDGNVSGRTGIAVTNTNPGPGSLNQEGIPVVIVNGNTDGNEFTLPGGPIDTGFFDYDLFFEETNSGVFELRSFLSGGAYLLPQLMTSVQDIFHATSETWLDRTADLRVLLNGGGPVTPLKGGKAYGGEPHREIGSSFTPAVWVRGSGTWLDRGGGATTNAGGRSYQYNLDRDLEIGDFQSGIDFGQRGVISSDDILVFGILGGAVFANLDYDALARRFQFSGGQFGGFATYLNGGLFVDTLVKGDFLAIEQDILGFPGSVDANTLGIRTDSGYRFGGFNGGFFLEPQATIEVMWSDIDGFTVGPNTVSFDGDPAVRGRVGLRAGTSYEAWPGTIMEPFVIGSLWGNLSGDNQATLTSNGTRFALTDDVPDSWGVVSGGVNFFNPGAQTSVFAKLDVTFGDELEGTTGRVGMRYNW